MPRTDEQLNRLTACPHLTLEVLERYEQAVLRTEAEANEQFVKSLRARKAARAYIESQTK